MQSLVHQMAIAYPDIMKTVELKTNKDVWFCPSLFFNGAQLNMSAELFEQFKNETITLAKLCQLGQAFNPSMGYQNVSLWNYDTSDYDGSRTAALRPVQNVYEESIQSYAQIYSDHVTC